MTLGMNANNPWNLQQDHVQWLGLTPNQKEGGELCFDTLQDGIRAGIRLCYTYQARGLNTPSLFIEKFAPAAAGNPTAQYIQNVCLWTGFMPNQQLDFHDVMTMGKFAQAIFRQEQGADNGINDSEILTAIEKANV